MEKLSIPNATPADAANVVSLPAAAAQPLDNLLPSFAMLLKDSLVETQGTAAQIAPESTADNRAFVLTGPLGQSTVGAPNTSLAARGPSASGRQPAPSSPSNDADPTALASNLALALLGFVPTPVIVPVASDPTAVSQSADTAGSVASSGGSAQTSTQMGNPLSPPQVPTQPGAGAISLATGMPAWSNAVPEKKAESISVAPSDGNPQASTQTDNLLSPPQKPAPTALDGTSSNSDLNPAAPQSTSTPAQSPKPSGEASNAPTIGTLLQQVAAMKSAMEVRVPAIFHVTSSGAPPQMHSSPSDTALPKSATPLSLATPSPALAPSTDPASPAAEKGFGLQAGPAPIARQSGNAQSETSSQSNSQSDARSSKSQSDITKANAFAAAAPTTPDADASSLAQAAAAARIAPGGAQAPASGVGPSATSDSTVPSPALAHHSAEPPDLQPGLQAWDAGQSAQTRLVQSAHLSGSLDQSEMNIAMQTDKLGAVELRARVTGDQVGAAIAVERHDAHALLNSDLAALHQALADRQLRVENVSLFQGSLHSSTAGDHDSASHQRDAGPQRPAAGAWATGNSSLAPQAVPSVWMSETGTVFDSNGRLSVRA